MPERAAAISTAWDSPFAAGDFLTRLKRMWASMINRYPCYGRQGLRLRSGGRFSWIWVGSTKSSNFTWRRSISAGVLRRRDTAALFNLRASSIIWEAVIWRNRDSGKTATNIDTEIDSTLHP